MNKTAIKNFAVRARRKLIEEVTHKAYEIGITKDKAHEIETFAGGFKIKGRENGRTFKNYEKKQREKLIEIINDKGFSQVAEEVAYTWFNRFIALRFMEVNNYFPTGVRVLSSTEEGKAEPDIIKEALNIDLEVDRNIIFRLQDSNDTEDLYKYLLIKQCNQLGKIMPTVFEEIEDYTELLLPDKLLAEGSIIRDLVENIEEYDWKIELDEEEQKLEAEKGEHGIEIIGWLYQYYISEKKDGVFAGLKQNKKITKENIPAATQLFTPKWIVKYMVENSLGRLWLESHPNEDLKAQWKYYLEEAEQEPEVQKQLDALKNPNLNPEEIKVLDPAMGSGHILVYAFDVLYEIYLSAGYSEREIPTLILEKNLFGLDIDDRAGQLACFALLMKARSKNRRIFRNRPKLNLCSIQESNGIPIEVIDYLIDPEETEIEKVVHRDQIEYLINVFHDAKEYGSILEVKEIDFDALERRIEEIKDVMPVDIFEFQYKEVILEKVVPLVQQARIMSQRYDVVCTNPPYMGKKGINDKLGDLLKNFFPNSKSDLGTVFMELNLRYACNKGIISMINIPSWMFLTSYSILRENIIDNFTILNMLHLGRGVFGSDFGTTTFVIRKLNISLYNAVYRKLFFKQGAVDSLEKKEKWFFESVNKFVNKQNVFKVISSTPIAYWISKEMYKVFKLGKPIMEIGDAKQGLATSDNNRFVRLWNEIEEDKIMFNKFNQEKKWCPYNKGGEFRKWYGNNSYIVNWENNGTEIKNYKKSVVRNETYYFREGITWTLISSSLFGVRYIPEGFIFDVNGMTLFVDEGRIKYTLAFMSSKVCFEILKAINSTMAFQVGDINRIPVIFEEKYKQSIDATCNSNITISRNDWNYFETSWDFNNHPLLVHKKNSTIEEAFNNWSNFTNQQFNQLKHNEEELNRIFIEIYGLQDELTPEVDDKDITINKADRERDIKSFISYAVGCIFGRYSLDEVGLIYAGGDFSDKFRVENGTWEINTKDCWKKSSVAITKDNVIPIAEGDYFEDDLVERLIEFVKVSFGQETLEENLNYIAETLGKKNNETSKQAIRRYFLKDFYKDHIKTYKKRPIYWLFDSGKQNGFKALIYLHRYDPFTVARVRTDYLHKLQKKYDAEINHLDIIIDSNISDREKAAARKKKESIMKQIEECRTYDQAIAHVANQKIAIDLDDGVAVNYAKFQGVEIPQGEGRKPLKADLLAKI